MDADRCVGRYNVEHALPLMHAHGLRERECALVQFRRDGAAELHSDCRISERQYREAIPCCREN